MLKLCFYFLSGNDITVSDPGLYPTALHRTSLALVISCVQTEVHTEATFSCKQMPNRSSSNEQLHLGQSQLLDAVNIRFSVLLDRSAVRFITGYAVDEWLHEHTNRADVLGQASHSTLVTSDHTHPVSPEVARRADASFQAAGGFKVEVVVDEAHIEVKLRTDRTFSHLHQTFGT